MDATVPLLAGTVSTTVFAGSVLPMLVKAVRSRDLSSYSLANLALANFGNLVHSVYVFSLPPGPIWVLHAFYLLSTGLMLAWYVRWGRARPVVAEARGATSAEAAPHAMEVGLAAGAEVRPGCVA
jgi:hypothetical protein